MDPLVAAELRRTRNALSSVISAPVATATKTRRPARHAGAGWKDAVRAIGDPAVVADKWRTDWDGSDVPSGIKQLGTAGLAGLQLGARLGKSM